MFSDLVGFFVEFVCEGSRTKFEQEDGQQTVQNDQKISIDDDAAGITSLVPGIKNLRLRNGLKFDRAY